MPPIRRAMCVMNTKLFKPGDKVEVVEVGRKKSIQAGQVYTVYKMRKGDRCPGSFVRLVGIDISFCAARFKLVKKEEANAKLV
jgi:hypothetical protein